MSKSDGVMVILLNACHKIHSYLYENSKYKLFNITARIKEKKLKIALSYQDTSIYKCNLSFNGPK